MLDGLIFSNDASRPTKTTRKMGDARCAGWALAMGSGTGSKADISLISATYSLKLWHLPVESTRYHNLMSSQAQKFCLDTAFKRRSWALCCQMSPQPQSPP